ncbi:unnamed protein product [Spodoptera exigua]|nr:unnamed protein product [Spodoptera exigua]
MVSRRGGGGGAVGACVLKRYVAVWSHGVSHGTDALKRRLRAPAHARHCLPMRCAYRSLQCALYRAMHVALPMCDMSLVHGLRAQTSVAVYLCSMDCRDLEKVLELSKV